MGGSGALCNFCCFKPATFSNFLQIEGLAPGKNPKSESPGGLEAPGLPLAVGQPGRPTGAGAAG